MNKKIVYIDMDNVLVDFQSGIDALDPKTQKEYEGRYDEVPGIFAKMRPIPGAIETINALGKQHEVYILSTAPWNNPTAWSDKLEWVKRYLGETCHKRLILSHHKNLNRGDFLIDDRKKNGAEKFEGELLLFGSEKYPDWRSIRKYLLDTEALLEEFKAPVEHLSLQEYKNRIYDYFIFVIGLPREIAQSHMAEYSNCFEEYLKENTSVVTMGTGILHHFL